MDDYDDCGMEPYEDDLETHELNELDRDRAAGEFDDAEPSSTYIMVHRLPSSVVEFFGIYVTYEAMTHMLTQVFGDNTTHTEVEDTRGLPGKLTDGVDRVYIVDNGGRDQGYYILETIAR